MALVATLQSATSERQSLLAGEKDNDNHFSSSQLGQRKTRGTQTQKLSKT